MAQIKLGNGDRVLISITSSEVAIFRMTLGGFMPAEKLWSMSTLEYITKCILPYGMPEDAVPITINYISDSKNADSIPAVMSLILKEAHSDASGIAVYNSIPDASIADVFSEIRSTCGDTQGLSMLTDEVTKIIKTDKELYIETLRNNDTRQIAHYNMIMHISGARLVSGHLHVYAGILSPEGEEIKEIFMYAANKLKGLGFLTSETYAESVGEVSGAISFVG